MSIRRGQAAALLSMLLLLAGCAQLPNPTTATGPIWQATHPALAYAQWSPLPDSVVHALRVDLHAPGVRVQVSPIAERGQTLAEMPSNATATASVNASFFDKNYAPRGFTVSQGEAWEPVLNVWNSPLLACDARPRCVIQTQPPYALQPGWLNVVAGTPWLLEDGRARSALDDASCASLCAAKHPRTAVGLDATGRYLYLVVAEGRRPPVLGLSLVQLSALMRQLGARQAINLDGGGSSTMLLQGRSVLARPFNEPQLRKLANALQIVLP